MSLAELKLISNEMDRRLGVIISKPTPLENRSYLPEIKELTKRVEAVENKNAELPRVLPGYIPTDEVTVQKLIAEEISTYTMYKEYFYIGENGEKHIVRLDLTVSCVFDKAQNLLYFISEAVDWERRL